jgi:hypothetical protein
MPEPSKLKNQQTKKLPNNMFKQFTNKQLLIVFLVLLGLYALSFAFGGKKSGSFRKNLAVVDTAQVNKIEIDAAKAESAFSLSKSDLNWQLQTGDKTVSADRQKVKNALGSLALLEATQLVARDPEQWAEYQVDEEGGTRVKLQQGGETLLDLVIGRFEYKQSGLMSYVRLADEEDVYLVKGFLDATFNQEGDAWRNYALLRGNASDWMNVTFTYPDSSFQLFKGMDNTWRLSDSTEVDQTEVTSYLSAISSLTGSEFVDNPPAGAATQKVEVADASGKAIALSAYPADTSYVVNSSFNPEAYFDGAAGDLYSKVFVGRSKFVK